MVGLGGGGGISCINRVWTTKKIIYHKDSGGRGPVHDRVGTQKSSICHRNMGIGWGEDPIHDRVGTKKVPSITGSVGEGGGKGGGREIPCMTELGPKKFHLSQGQWEEAEGRGREGDPIHDRVGTKKVPSITGSVGGGGGKGGGREIPYMTELGPKESSIYHRVSGRRRREGGGREIPCMTELGPKKFHLSQGQWEEAEGRGEGGRSHTWQSWDPKKFHLSQGQWEEAEGRGREGDPMHGRVGYPCSLCQRLLSCHQLLCPYTYWLCWFFPLRVNSSGLQRETEGKTLGVRLELTGSVLRLHINILYIDTKSIMSFLFFF